jgi:hypothetical protein
MITRSCCPGPDGRPEQHGDHQHLVVLGVDLGRRQPSRAGRQEHGLGGVDE